ncbi:MAG: YggS family pyridoxal phosphate-dependent enzyme, partial [Planctomycetota bacterium]
VVVTKAAPPWIFGALAETGVRDVGETRVQAAATRRPGAPEGLTWHGIGHLQRNKAGQAVRLFDVFHALDSARLADRLESVLAGDSRVWPVYIEVHAAADPAKAGVAPEETLAFMKDVCRHPHLDCRGFMTMARLGAGEHELRQTFSALREIRDEAGRQGIGDKPADQLSMGMTDDFEIAVEEGATVVRVGRAIFDRPCQEADRGHAEEERV